MMSLSSLLLPLLWSLHAPKLGDRLWHGEVDGELLVLGWYT
jgi:hypothetical protein